MRIRPISRWTTTGTAALITILAGPLLAAEPAARATSPDLANLSSPNEAAPAEWAGKELPVRMIPNIPESAEAYYAPDNFHVIAQTKDPMAAQPEKGKVGGSLTFTYTDTGEELTRINDKGQDACSWFVLPDGKRVIWTSTRDHPEMPPGNWSEETDYPQGAELYTSDLKGGDPAYNAGRLTALLDGSRDPYRDVVLLNAAAALIVAGRADTLKLGADLAAREIDSGRARATLDKLVKVSNA